MNTCTDCKTYGAIMTEGVCADCYWEEDSRRKLANRNDSNWVFSRVYSSAIQLLGKTHDEAIQIATATVQTKFKTSR